MFYFSIFNSDFSRQRGPHCSAVAAGRLMLQFFDEGVEAVGDLGGEREDQLRRVEAGEEARADAVEPELLEEGAEARDQLGVELHRVPEIAPIEIAKRALVESARRGAKLTGKLTGGVDVAEAVLQVHLGEGLRGGS